MVFVLENKIFLPVIIIIIILSGKTKKSQGMADKVSEEVVSKKEVMHSKKTTTNFNQNK